MQSRLDSQPQLRGRSLECARLDQLISQARAGLSGSLIVRGEAGIGKTALLDYTATHAAGCRITRSVGVESEMELAFAGLHLLCAPLIERLELLPGPQRDALGTAFGLSLGDSPDRFLVGLAVLSLLAAAAEKEPVVCLIDDAQWLDRASAQVLGFVARRLVAESVVIIFATRQPAELVELAGLPELTVEPLDQSDAMAVLAAAIPGKMDERVQGRILREAGGNPLALLELPRAWTPAAFAGGYGLPDGHSVSDRIEASFRRRLLPLPARTRTLLLVAAAEPVGDSHLVFAAAERLGIGRDALAPAAAAGLVDGESQLRFRHPVVRSVVYREASARDRRVAHGALADATDGMSDPDRRAWHLAAAAAGPDEAIARELEGSAGRAQARGGLAAAAAFLRRAVDLTADPAQRSQRAFAAAQASLQGGAFDATIELLSIAEAGPLEEFPRALADLLRGQVAFSSGFGPEGPELLLSAARRLEAFDPDLARETYLTAWGGAVGAAHLTGDSVLKEICRAIRELAPRPGGPRPLDLLLDGLARLTLDGHAAATPVLRRVVTRLGEISETDVLHWGWATRGACAVLWDEDAAHRVAMRCIETHRDAGALAQLPIHLSALAVSEAWSGDFAMARSLISESDSVAAATGNQLAPYALVRLRALQGLGEADSVIVGLIEQRHPHGYWADAVLNNGLGHYHAAESSAQAVAASTSDPWTSMWVLPELVEAAARSGDVQTARDALERLADTTRLAGTDLAAGIEARSRALVSDDDTADNLYREGVDRLRRANVRTELGRAHLVYGEWLRRQGRRVDARGQLRTAHEIFTSIGMAAFAERTRRELLATGERVRRRAVDARDDLTPQEEQIARLARDGRSNAEISAQLFLSPRTVEWHLRKVFSKLGISSRKELRDALPELTRTAAPIQGRLRAGPAASSRAPG